MIDLMGACRDDLNISKVKPLFCRVWTAIVQYNILGTKDWT